MKKLAILGVGALILGVIAVVSVFMVQKLDRLTVIEAQPSWDAREDIYLKGGASGGCDWAGTCPHFVLFQNGDFINYSGQFNDETAVTTYGTYKPKEFTDIKRGIESLDLDYLTQKANFFCISGLDGSDTYYLLQDGTKLMDCQMQFGGDEEAQSILWKAWPDVR